MRYTYDIKLALCTSSRIQA